MNTNRQNIKRIIQPYRFCIAIVLFFTGVSLGCILFPGKVPTPPPNILPSATIYRMEKASPVAASPTALSPSPQAKFALTATAIWESGTESGTDQTNLGTPIVVPQFKEEDCGCANFPATVDAKFGPGFLQCNYRWSGEYVDDNAMSLIIEQHYAQSNFEDAFNELIAEERNTAQYDQDSINAGSAPGNEQYIARNDPTGFTFITTSPGGQSSKTQGEIPMCGNGGGVIRLPGDYLVKIRIAACDLGADREAYQAAIESLEDCAVSNIERAATR